MKFCVLIPVFNGARTIGFLIEEIRKFAQNVIVVDDGSIDRTAEIARTAQVIVLSHDENKGKGASLQTGFEYILKNTDFEYVILMDADGQHSPEFIPRFLEKASESKADIIVGNRMENSAAMPLLRKLTNKVMSSVISRIARQNIPDTQCGYRLISRRVLEAINLETSNYDTDSEILLKAARQKFKIESAKISTIYRHESSSINPFIDTIRFIKLIAKTVIFKR